MASAPAGGFGTYATRRKGSPERPYRTLIAQLEPLRASCDCRDFVRNSLGLCKHVLTSSRSALRWLGALKGRKPIRLAVDRAGAPDGGLE